MTKWTGRQAEHLLGGRKEKEQEEKEQEEEGNRERERRDEVLLHLESCRHICSSMMSARQQSAVILDCSQVEQRYRLAPCLPASLPPFVPRKLVCLSSALKIYSSPPLSPPFTFCS